MVNIILNESLLYVFTLEISCMELLLTSRQSPLVPSDENTFHTIGGCLLPQLFLPL